MVVYESILDEKDRFSVLNPITYIKQSKAEFDKVIWPTRVQTVRLTAVVIMVSIVVGAYIAGIDILLTKFTSTFLIK